MEKIPVFQHKKAKKDLETKGYYIRGRNYYPAEGRPGYKDIYVLDLLLLNLIKKKD